MDRTNLPVSIYQYTWEYSAIRNRVWETNTELTLPNGSFRESVLAVILLPLENNLIARASLTLRRFPAFPGELLSVLVQRSSSLSFRHTAILLASYSVMSNAISCLFFRAMLWNAVRDYQKVATEVLAQTL